LVANAYPRVVLRLNTNACIAALFIFVPCLTAQHIQN